MAFACGQRIRKRYTASVARCKDLSKGIVQPLDQRWNGPEIRRQWNEIQRKGLGIGNFQPHFFHTGKQFRVGIAEKIDGLHGIPDQKAGAAHAVGPGGDQAGEQLVLAAAGVLKLVDKEVMDSVGDSDGGVSGGSVFGLEDALRDLGYLDEVDLRSLGKHHLELRGSVAQHHETGPNDGPVIFAVADGG